MANTKIYSEIFDYLRSPLPPSEAYGNFVFGRADRRLVHKMGELYVAGLAKYFLVTGGIGKDSGELAQKGIAESTYLGDEAAKSGIPNNMLHLETEARNGGENVRLGMSTIQQKGLPHDKLTVVAHATSTRRLAAMLDHEGRQIAPIDAIYRVPTDYPFDPENPADQDEARAELLRLADWPTKGWLGEQSDLPVDLVDFARDQDKK